MRVKHPTKHKQGDRLIVYEKEFRVAQQLADLRGSRGCGRCGGLLVAERMDSYADVFLQNQVSALRCVQCGDVVDHIILRNRMDPVAARRQDPREALWEDQPAELRLCAAGK